MELSINGHYCSNVKCVPQTHVSGRLVPRRTQEVVEVSGDGTWLAEVGRCRGERTFASVAQP